MLTLFIAAVLALPACGGDDDSATTPAGPSEADIAVISDWAEALAESDTEAAAEFFAIPSYAENGLTYDIETTADAVRFNESLPCGATLESTTADGELITATFELTERPGEGPCPGSGNLAKTSFLIEDGKIVEWLRVPIPAEPETGQIT
jgi:hypothetical protein